MGAVNCPPATGTIGTIGTTGTTGTPYSAPGHGTMVVLNGTSSAGKTSVARAFQTQMAAQGIPYLYLGADAFFDSLPAQYADDPESVMRVWRGFHRCLPALAACGNSLIVDTLF